MSHITFAKYKHNNTTAVSPIFDNTTFDEIKCFLINRWANITKDGISMFYSLPGDSRCELTCEDDFNTMISMVKIHMLKFVQILVYEHGKYNGNDDCYETAIVPVGNGYIDSVPIVPTLDSVGFDDIHSDIDHQTDDEIDDQTHVLSSISWKSLIIGVNQEFMGGVVEFRSALIRFSVYHGFEFNYLRNDSKRVKAVCKREDIGCKWRIHASSDECLVFYIRSMESNHSCGCGNMIRNSKRLNSNIIGEEVSDKIKRNPLYRPCDIFFEFPKTHGCDISYTLAYNGVEKAKQMLFGDYVLSYDETRLYLESARKSNPGSHLIIDSDPISKRFKRLFISFHASIVGFSYCRPVLFLDGTFLTGRFRGQMLCATAKDGNNGLFLLAYAIVDSENIENWTWFMEQMRIILTHDREITFISDRHKGLLEAVSKVFPGFPHGYCTIHLKNNLRTCMTGKPAAIKEGILKIFDKVTYASTVQRYEEKLADLKAKGGKKVSDFMDGISPDHFSHAFFKGRRYGEVTSNAAESINNMFRLQRQLPILGLIDGIRVRLMKQYASNRDSASSWPLKLCPKIQKQINKTLEAGQTWSVDNCTDYIFEVGAKKTVVVNLTLRTCTCNGWQINQFPCSHALTTMYRRGIEFYLYVDEYYHVKSYQSSYQLAIFPVPTLDIQSTTRETAQILPPISKSQPGRRRLKRILSKGEPTRKYKCRRCGKIGHNKKGCRERVEEIL